MVSEHTNISMFTTPRHLKNKNFKKNVEKSIDRIGKIWYDIVVVEISSFGVWWNW